MENTNAYSHLTLEERRIIIKGITNGSTKTAIAQTIGKEIKAHRILVKKCPLPLECQQLQGTDQNDAGAACRHSGRAAGYRMRLYAAEHRRRK